MLNARETLSAECAEAVIESAQELVGENPMPGQVMAMALEKSGVEFDDTESKIVKATKIIDAAIEADVVGDVRSIRRALVILSAEERHRRLRIQADRSRLFTRNF